MELFTEYQQVEETAEAAAWIAERSGGMKFRLLETYESPEFTAKSEVTEAEMEGTYGGCLFGAEAEIRWRREAGRWHLWWLSEKAPGEGRQARLLRCRRRKAHYYLVGVWQKDGRYGEPHFKEVPEYPLKESPKEGDRARLEVMEYLAHREAVGDPEASLNQPRLVAYRLMGLSSGRDEE
jgi:hypothetical protein